MSGKVIIKGNYPSVRATSMRDLVTLCRSQNKSVPGSGTTYINQFLDDYKDHFNEDAIRKLKQAVAKPETDLMIIDQR